MDLSRPILKVRRVEDRAEPVLDFHENPWTDIEAESLSHYMGDTPSHRPMTAFKIGYDRNAIFLIFRVRDNYVRAVAETYQGPVFRDSCVEFFFSPNPEVSDGYFNLEVNCCGVALFEFHPGDGREMIRIPDAVFKEIRIVHHLDRKIDPEITSPLTWSVALRIPVGILLDYGPVTWPEPGESWRANFHKCADLSSHPHWLTWAKIDFPTPRFHLPKFFGRLLFE